MGWLVSRQGPGGGGGTPTCIPQNHPHATLIILNIQKWGKTSQKILPVSSGSHQPRSDLEVGSGVTTCFCVFHPLLNSPQNSEYFEFRHMGQQQTCPLWEARKKISSTFGAKTSNCTKRFENFGGSRGGRGGGGGSGFKPAAPPLGDPMGCSMTRISEAWDTRLAHEIQEDRDEILATPRKTCAASTKDRSMMRCPAESQGERAVAHTLLKGGARARCALQRPGVRFDGALGIVGAPLTYASASTLAVRCRRTRLGGPWQGGP